jgi:hypothetical protein
MDLTWADIAQPLVAGLAGMLGVYVTEETLRALRRRGLCPERWNRDRTFLLPRGRGGQRAADDQGR